MRKFILLATITLAVLSLSAQSVVTVTFTCRTTDSLYVPPDYIVVENLDREWMETIHFPDTVYQLLVGTGLTDYSEESGLPVSPNPFNGVTFVECDLSESGGVTVDVTDLAGQHVVTKRDEVSQPGRYSFRVTLSKSGTYLINLCHAGKTAVGKLVNAGCGGGDAVELIGVSKEHHGGVQGKESLKGTSSHPFQLGDQMRYVAYASDNASWEVIQYQNESDTVTLVFNPFPELGDSQPCPGTPTVTDYDGNIYNTVKIGHQCWLKENLRVTHYADGTEIPLGGEIGSFTDPFYYDHLSSGLSLSECGYLYNWIAVMNGDSYSMLNPSGVQGVCPDGWHVPSALEWYQLIDYMSNQSEYICDGIGQYTGKALAAQTSWPESVYSCCVGHYPYTNNATGFSAYSTGNCIGSFFDNAGAFFCSCSRYVAEPSAFVLAYNSQRLNHAEIGVQIGLSVRCLRD